MKPARRYEIYLPLTYNDGQRIEKRTFDQLEAELISRFAGLTIMPRRADNALRGLWQQAGQLYRDQIIVATIYAYDVAEADEWLTSYKEALKDRFQQLEVLIIAFPVDVL